MILMIQGPEGIVEAKLSSIVNLATMPNASSAQNQNSDDASEYTLEMRKQHQSTQMDILKKLSSNIDHDLCEILSISGSVYTYSWSAAVICHIKQFSPSIFANLEVKYSLIDCSLSNDLVHCISTLAAADLRAVLLK